MSNHSADASDSTIRQYLLGQLSADEQQRVEERFFLDDSFFREIELAEDELTEEYLAGRLAAKEKRRFEQHFLTTPARQRHLRITRALRQAFTESPSLGVLPRGAPWRLLHTTPATWMALAAGLLALWLGSTFYLWRQLSEQRTAAEVHRQEFEKQAATREIRIADLERQLRSERDAQAPPPSLTHVMPRRPAVLSFVLMPNVVMRGQPAKRTALAIPGPAKTVQLTLDLEVAAGGSSASYRAILETSDGRQLMSRDGLKPIQGGHAVVFTAPTALLQPGQYGIALWGRRAQDNMEKIDDYLFSVVRR